MTAPVRKDTHLQFGLFYEQQLPRPWHEEDDHRLLKEALEQVEIADRLGYQYAWAVEHHFLEEYSHSSAPEVFLAACSQRTTQIRLGHGIVQMPAGFNHPARVAERIATLDLVSDGRVEWGTGESSSRMELEGFQINPMFKRKMWQEATREAARMLAMSPYPGYEGEFWSMPARNLVPKSLQKPHPPMWLACSNRETIRLAASLGLGALTFAFVDPTEAKHWVDEYYETFEKECRPLGRTVNPNIAMVLGFACDESHETAIERGLEGFRFFQYALKHYYVTGTHVPGETDVWEAFKAAPTDDIPSTHGIGTPDELRDAMASFEEAGVDQIILLQQAGLNQHEQIVQSLELFGQSVLPEFRERETEKHRQKQERLGPAIERAMARITPLSTNEPMAPVEAYPVSFAKLGRTRAERGRTQVAAQTGPLEGSS